MCCHKFGAWQPWQRHSGTWDHGRKELGSWGHPVGLSLAILRGCLGNILWAAGAFTIISLTLKNNLFYQQGTQLWWLTVISCCFQVRDPNWPVMVYFWPLGRFSGQSQCSWLKSCKTHISCINHHIQISHWQEGGGKFALFTATFSKSSLLSLDLAYLGHDR